MATASKEFYLPFVKKEKVAEDTYSFYFNQAQHGFDFLPGQYIRMTLPIKNPNHRGSSRFFTIASSPLDKKYIMITTRVIKIPPPDGRGYSSFKKKLIELKAGKQVQFFGPMGGFILNEEEKGRRVFLAGGIGITPFHSMITFADQKHLSIPIYLFVSFSTVGEMIFYEELSAIVSSNPNIEVVYTISHPQRSADQWEGETGRISEVLIKKYVPNILEPSYYIVGPPKMVTAIEEVVRNMDIESNKIFIENFTGY